MKEWPFDSMAMNYGHIFIGHYNASNLLAVYAASLLLGAKKEEVLSILSDLHPVSGRLEIIRSAGGISAIVDYGPYSRCFTKCD